ncbi:polyprenyl diphosphate synthase [Streptomyces eurocidicus]|uniref:Isoprenyl transferase n=1 Tax=Streptomyces eurocidicus TaxID=66423 RepID=A0A7W8BAV2_STREU|nr:polyprenyl diphosphate synthase [Streptomyces eurocidicus]MBB5119442.1 short-chain Z-isoprenyl diphosphate synthase [Streptomyces eurocidicus]MBF6052979.1 di-trans,poly-cis-decaprenylcistransferase [Streptomyces eurocidicus]
MSLTTGSGDTLVSPVASGQPLLRHLAVILDGNRRWAHDRGLPILAGYQRGGQRVLDLLSWCRNAHEIETVTLWPLSIENLRRPHGELTDLLCVIMSIAEQIAATGHWRIRIIGAPEVLPAPLADGLVRLAHRSGHRSDPVVNIAVAYGGRDEITRAVRNLILAHREAGTLPVLADGIRPEEFDHYLDTSGQPDPDLVIRTSGEQRLSGFMPWQTVYSEFYFCPVHWPEFDKGEFDKALGHYRTRRRRLGL